VFESEAGRLFESDFTVSRSDGIVTVSDDANLLGQIDGTAANVRAVVQAVATFCDAAQRDDQSL
jgi:hypothetical protein